MTMSTVEESDKAIEMLNRYVSFFLYYYYVFFVELLVMCDLEPYKTRC